MFYVFKKTRLVELHSMYKHTEVEKRGTVITYYLPLRIAMQEALHVIHCK